MSPVPERDYASGRLAGGEWSPCGVEQILLMAKYSRCEWVPNEGELDVRNVRVKRVPYSGIFRYPKFVYYGNTDCAVVDLDEIPPGVSYGARRDKKHYRDVYGVEVSYQGKVAELRAVANNEKLKINLAHDGEAWGEAEIIGAAFLLPTVAWGMVRRNGIVIVEEPGYPSEPLLSRVAVPDRGGVLQTLDFRAKEEYFTYSRWEQSGKPVVVYGRG